MKIKNYSKIKILFASLVIVCFLQLFPLTIFTKAQTSWWDETYPVYKQITLTNNTSTTANTGTWVVVDIDHRQMVSDKLSLTSGDDIRIVYFNGADYEELKFKLEKPYSTDTYIAFTTQSTIYPSGVDSNYYLYYGNLRAEEYPRDYSFLPSDYQNILTPTLGKQIISENISTQLSRKWFLKDADIEIQPEVKLRYYVDAPGSSLDFDSVTYQILDTKKKGEMTWKTNSYETDINLSDLEVGTYQIQATATIGGQAKKSPISEFYISHPLYVTWTMDWEGVGVEETYLYNMAGLSAQYGAPITHFFNPHLLVNSSVSKKEKKELTEWVRKRNIQYGDEIGVHIHGQYDSMTEAGVTPITWPKWDNLNDGYDVPLSEYSYEDTIKILNWAKEVFKDNGLGNPISFRAGGWYADLDTLRAVQDTGFLIDSSGREAYTFGRNNIPGHWDLKSTTHPYKPSTTNQNSDTPAPNLDIWEFPNNAMDSTNETSVEMIKRFNDNYYQKPLEEPQVVTYLSHPHYFEKDKREMEKVFQHTDQYAYSKDGGPVVYATLRNSFKYLTNQELPPEEVEPVTESPFDFLGTIEFNIWWIIVPFGALALIILILKLLVDRAGGY